MPSVVLVPESLRVSRIKDWLPSLESINLHILFLSAHSHLQTVAVHRCKYGKFLGVQLLTVEETREHLYGDQPDFLHISTVWQLLQPPPSPPLSSPPLPSAVELGNICEESVIEFFFLVFSYIYACNF